MVFVAYIDSLASNITVYLAYKTLYKDEIIGYMIHYLRRNIQNYLLLLLSSTAT